MSMPIVATPFEAALAVGRRVLVFGEPGTGKSTLVAQTARVLFTEGCGCSVISADPGSPAFGIPGAVSRGLWDGDGWDIADQAALCTLDSARFRLPLTISVRRLAEGAPAGTMLIDPPGVVRGVAGAELLEGMVDATGADLIVVLARQPDELPLWRELAALPVEVIVADAGPEARRLSKRARAAQRSRPWDRYLEEAPTWRLRLDEVPLVGTPPPGDIADAWKGRQLALLNRDGAVRCFAEVVSKEGDDLAIRGPRADTAEAVLLIRDACRGPDGLLRTAAPRARRDGVVRVPDMMPPAGLAEPVPQPPIRVGSVTAVIVNGVFGDPLLHLRLRHQRRSLLFDLGEAGRLPARIAHQVSDVFISHAHIDHIGGFLWLLRSRMGDFPACRLFGPPGLTDRIEALLNGIHWDRIGDAGPRFEVAELHGDRLRRFLLRAGGPGRVLLPERDASEGILLAEPDLQVRATTLDHGIPVLAFAFEPAVEIKVRKDRLRARGLAPGPWLGELKRCVGNHDLEKEIRLPDGQLTVAAILVEDLILVAPGKKLVYATDLADTPDNRQRLIQLAAGAHTLFCEATFLGSDAVHATNTGHLTTRACGEIAAAAGVEHLIPFHFSRRYERDVGCVYAEVRAACAAAAIP